MEITYFVEVSEGKEMGYGCYFVDSGELKKIKEMTDKTIETNFFFLHMNQVLA